MDCSLADSSIHEILQARILEWVIKPFFRGSSQSRDQTHFSMSPALTDEFFTTSITWEAYSVLYGDLKGKEIQKERVYVYLQLLLLLSHFSRVQLCATPWTAAHQAPVPGILQARALEWVAIAFPMYTYS